MTGTLRPPVRIWRIEHPADGYGPFAKFDPRDGMTPRPHVRYGRQGDWIHPTQMPGPGSQRYLRDTLQVSWAWNDNIRFAFPTAQELCKWFSGWSLLQLTVQGYEVLQLAIPWDKHIRTPCQVMYDRRHARVLRRVAPADVMWEAPGPVTNPRSADDYDW